MFLANQCPWQRPCFTVAPPLFTSHSTTITTNFIPLLTAHSRRNASTTTLHLSVWKYRSKRCCIKARVDSKSEQSSLLQPVSVKIPVGDRHIVIETGRIGRQASGSVTVTDGETILYASVCMSNVLSEPSDFLPLTVNYQERFSAAGRTSGGFFKREGRAKEKEILICRLIDRPLRPTIMKGFLHDVQILSWVLSYDAIHSPDSLAIVAAGAALALSEVPIAKPVAGVRVGLVDDQFVVNPTLQQMELSKLDLMIAGTSDAILMIEGYSNFLSEESLLKAVEVGEVAVRNICKDLELLMRNYGKEKVMDTIRLPPAELYDHVEELAGKQILKALQIKNKIPRMRKISAIEDNILSVLTDTGLVDGDLGSQNDEMTDDIDDEDDEEIVDGLVDEGDVHIKPTPRKFFTQLFDPLDVKLAFKEVTSKIMRRFIVQNQRRSDGRNVEEVRQITAQCGLLPRAHGSALFTRGETQSLAVATLGGNNMAQRIDNLTEDETKRFYFQYSFPPSCVGEVGRIGAPSRREIGHGALTERALEPALPSNEEFPYTVRVESTITESNGSSSMASVCGGSLALLDAGVPLKCSIAGIAMGMIFDTRECGGDGSPMILSDILGSEDALGDMDLKVAGNKNSITAFQMDLKLTTGITSTVLKQAVLQARRGICHILGEMEKCFPPPSGKLSKHAPVIGTIKVETSQISLIIGPSGRTLKGIIDETGVEAIDIRQEDGLTTIVSRDLESIEKAKSRINGLTMVPAVGDIYRDCEVKSLAPYGAFVEIAPGREGLLHVSELDTKYVSKAEDVVKVGDRVDVKLIEVTEKGHLRLSRRALLPPPETPPADRIVDEGTTTIPVKHSNNTNIEVSAVKPQNKIKEAISAAKADGNNSNQIVNKQATARNNIKEVVSAIKIDKNSKQIVDKQATAQNNIKEVVSAVKIDKTSKQIVSKQATVRTKQLNTNVKQNSSAKEVPPAVEPEVE